MHGVLHVSMSPQPAVGFHASIAPYGSKLLKYAVQANLGEHSFYELRCIEGTRLLTSSSTSQVPAQRGAWGGTRLRRLLRLARRGSGPPRLDGGRPPRSRHPPACRAPPAATPHPSEMLGLCASTYAPRLLSLAGRIGRSPSTAPRCR